MANIGEMTRRDFNRLVLGAGATAAGLILPQTSLGHHEEMKDVRVVPVTEDMTANLVMDYIANQAGLDLGKHVTDDATKYMSVHLGDKSPKTVWVGVNVDDVVLSDQIAWRTTEEGVKPFSRKMKVGRTPDMIDYVFPGDTLVLDLSKMSADDRAKVVAKFGDPKINVTREQLEGHVEQKYGKLVERQKAAIAKLSAIEPARVERYTNMKPLDFVVRAVDKGVGDTMYNGLKGQGVKFISPVGYKELVELAAEPSTHREVTEVGQPMIYFGLIYDRGNRGPGNIGLSAKTKNSAHLRYMGNLDELKAIIGARAFAQAWAERVPERTPTQRSADDKSTNVTDAFEAVYTPIQLGQFKKLAQNYHLIRAGNVADDLDPLTYMQERDYTFMRAAVQIVAHKAGRG